MELWASEPVTLHTMLRHRKTGEPAPPEVEQEAAILIADRQEGAAAELLQEVRLAMTDMELHARFELGGDVTAEDVARRIEESTSVLPMHPESHPLCGFSE